LNGTFPSGWPTCPNVLKTDAARFEVPKVLIYDPQRPLTHSELANALGVSRSYVSRLSRLGMPCDSVQATQAWIKKRSKEIGTDSSSQKSLTDARREKIRLECEILTLRLERERDSVELVPVSEIQKFMSYFVSFMAVATTSQSEHVMNECVGKPEIEIYHQLRQLFSKSIFMAALGYCKGGGENNPDPRLVAYAEKCVEQQFKHFPATGKAQFRKAAPRVDPLGQRPTCERMKEIILAAIAFMNNVRKSSRTRKSAEVRLDVVKFLTRGNPHPDEIAKRHDVT
jgi:hypothetical protein